MIPLDDFTTAVHFGEMKLAEYLSSKSLSLAAFARLIGVSTEAVRRYHAGERIPSLKIMPRIWLATNGLVGANDFYGLESPRTHRTRRAA